MTRKIDDIESNVNKARILIDEEQKNLSPEERYSKMQQKTKEYSKKYGIKIAKSS